MGDAGSRGPVRGRGTRLTGAGAVLLSLLVVGAAAAPLLAPYSPTARVGVPFARPSADHLLGTNDIGQDLFSELIFGTRVSLAVGLAAALSATAVGTAVGLPAGYRRGAVDTFLMRLVDVTLSLPFLPLLLVVAVFVGPGLATQVVVVAAVLWAGTARELRAQVISVRELDHVLAARAMGAGTGRVLARHVLPEVAPLVMPKFVASTRIAILLQASDHPFVGAAYLPR